jgi:tetratricopeptide (TPR) repeat protein
MAFKSLQSGLPGQSLIGYAFSLCCDAERYALQGSTSESHLCYKAAIGIFECVFGAKHPLVSEIQTTLRAAKAPACRVLCTAERLSQGIVRQSLLFEGSRVESSLRYLAQLYYDKRQFDRARPLLELLLSLEDSNHPGATPNAANTLELLAHCYEQAGRCSEGASAKQRAKAIWADGMPVFS